MATMFDATRAVEARNGGAAVVSTSRQRRRGWSRLSISTGYGVQGM